MPSGTRRVSHFTDPAIRTSQIRRECGKAVIVASPKSYEQQELQQELVERYDRLRSQRVDPRIDNALAITTDGRKLATDARMLSATAPDFPESKVNRLIENVAARDHVPS